MSILIKGMEMPTSCIACLFDVYGLCLINKNIEGKDELTHNCPLIPVPPHGRLIDSDALMLLVNMHGTNKFGMLDDDIREFINAAPTIIPAEEGEA